MKRCLWLTQCVFLLALSACKSVEPAAQPLAVVRSTADAPVPQSPTSDLSASSPLDLDVQHPSSAPTPPCISMPSDAKPKSAPRRRPSTARATPARAEEPAMLPVPGPGGASVRPVGGTSLSVLGKKVRGEKGEDFGRVVDVLADERGQVRLAIIESGGFLGVGDRRVAVDWSLLKFSSDAALGVLTLDVDPRDFQRAPEYKDNGHAVGLMGPSAQSFTGKQ
jgi:PRC-barrel domain